VGSGRVIDSLCLDEHQVRHWTSWQRWTVLAMLALYLGRRRHLSTDRTEAVLQELDAIPEKVARALELNDQIKALADRLSGFDNWLYLGRGVNYPLALEGALKLKEISYIHAEGLPAAEMKHGPIAMIDEKTPTVILTPSDSLYDKTLSNLQEIKARKGPIIAIATEGNQQIAKMVDEVVYVPATPEPLFPLLAVLPLQLLSYHIAVSRGCDVDKPRNLAKSVTVE
jgi:glucosamine--fructose-6-phosphate aminotransferase (isomerizing)